MTTDDILKKLENVQYPSMGYPAVCIVFIEGEWSAFLRNEEYIGVNIKCDTVNEAITKLYDYCKSKEYI